MTSADHRSMKEKPFSILWRYRYLWAFLVTSFVLVAATILTQGANFIAEDPTALGRLILLFGAFYTYGQYKERTLVSMVVVKNSTLEIHGINCVTAIPIEKITRQELVKAGKTLNGFGVPELLIEANDGSSYRILTNIKNYKDIEQALSSNKK